MCTQLWYSNKTGFICLLMTLQLIGGQPCLSVPISCIITKPVLFVYFSRDDPVVDWWLALFKCTHLLYSNKTGFISLGMTLQLIGGQPCLSVPISCIVTKLVLFVYFSRDDPVVDWWLACLSVPISGIVTKPVLFVYFSRDDPVVDWWLALFKCTHLWYSNKVCDGSKLYGEVDDFPEIYQVII